MIKIRRKNNMCEECRKSRSFFRGALFGTAIGAVIALLYAPKTGEETRKKLGEEAKKVKADLEPKIKEAQEKVGPMIEEAKIKAIPMMDRAKAEINKALEAVQEKAEQVSKEGVFPNKEKEKAKSKKGFFKGLVS
jgi:gas vesicle protein